MSLPINSALYFPSIEFRDYRWLWTSALLWDNIYRIQPDGFTPDEPDNVKALCEEGDVGIPLRPALYAGAVAKEFMDKVNSGRWGAAALDRNSINADYAKIHHDKIDVQIRQLLISRGAAASHEQWLYVPTDFEALYMTYLAKKMAEKNNLQPVSDANAAWTALTYYNVDNLETQCIPEDMPAALAMLMIENFVPQNITDIRPKELLEFRRKFPDERRNFMRAIQNAAKQLANCQDPAVVEDIVRTIQDDIARAIKDLKRSMETLGAETFAGFKTVSFPMATSVMAKILPLEFSQSVVLGTTGLTLGAIAGITSYRAKAKKLCREHEFAYLVHAQKTLSNTGAAGDVPRRLYRDMHEFIDD